MESNQSINTRFESLVGDIEPLESLEAATWGEFFGGVGIGVGIVGVVAGGIAIT